ncbi:glycosyltransferase [Chryseobacterium sp. MDT2-18]|uniref:glycosyltransferase n=1 Tax=Chryseobacterium sp. MDT2-18 TaxID=1259136 RepID=UPI00277E6774|nr:glycosyltransferase [Chryseobacterium sp. MDT2-18]MDQ0476577.1 glycosyltransferase involved in cell wall biosynthesis [Chryseobacterium sp. MDT2-18]
MKKKILFEVDIKDWAFYFMVKSWSSKLAGEYDCYYVCNDIYRIKELPEMSRIKITLLNTISKIRFKLYRTFSNQNKKVQFIDSSGNYSFPKYTKPLVTPFSDETKKVEILNFDYLVSMAYFFQYVAEIPFKGRKNLIGIFNDSFPHLGPENDLKTKTHVNSLSREAFFNKYLKSYDFLLLANDNLIRAYQEYTENLEFALGIYKEEFFGRTKIKSEEFTLGWTGNPHRVVKGFFEVIEPAVKKVLETGRKVRLKTSFNASYEEMIEFYNDVDLAVIASSGDGAPTMFCEASLSDIPSVSTFIGLPSMVIQDKVNGLFINRDIDEMANAIIYLYDNRDILEGFSKRIKKDYLNIMSNEKNIAKIRKVLQKLES